MNLLDGNPQISGNKRKKARTATQMLPRVVCFVHNVMQVRFHVSITYLANVAMLSAGLACCAQLQES